MLVPTLLARQFQESLEQLLCRLRYHSGAGGGGHLLKSPVDGHQNLPELICQCPIPAPQLPGWLPVTQISVFPIWSPKGEPRSAGSSAVPGFPGLGKGFGVGLAGLVVVSRGVSK